MQLHITAHPNTVLRIWLLVKSLNYLVGECTMIICKFDFKGLKSTFLNLKNLEYRFFSLSITFLRLKNPDLENNYYSILACVSLND